MIQQYDKIEINILNLCNLSCDNCSSASPYYKTNTYSIENFETDVKQLSKLCYYNTIILLGGEPFLLDNLETYIDILHHYKICDKIRIITNGTLLYNYHNQNIFNKIDILQISYYKNINNTLTDKWLETNKVPKTCKIQKNPIGHFYPLTSFEKRNDELTNNTFKRCPFKNCTTLYNGRIYLCEETISNQKLLKYNNIIIENFDKDSFDIYELNSGQNYSEKFNILKSKPLNSCNYCYGACGKQKKHSQVKKEKIF